VRPPADIDKRLYEPILAYLAVILIAASTYWLGRVVPFLLELSPGLLACAFLFGPQLAARLSGRPFDPKGAGITMDPWRASLRVLGMALVITWPLYLAGFFLFYGATCPVNALFHTLLGLVHPLCPSWKGLGFHLTVPRGFLLTALTQVLVVAIPEEVFFRGYLLSRFEARWPSGKRWLGVRLGWPLVLSSVLFGVGHFLVDFQPMRLAVVVPGFVFGYLRLRSGSVAAGALFHALCNLLAELLHESYF